MKKTSKKQSEEKHVPITQKGRGAGKTEPRHGLRPFEEMEHMFEEFFPRGWMHPSDLVHPFWRDLPTPLIRRLTPRVDIINRDHEIVLRAQIPGVDKEDLDVSISDNTVTIKGHTSHEEKEEKDDYYRRECSSGSFVRTFALPSEVDGTKAKATFGNGILELTIPKREKSKRHSIQID